MTPFFGTAAKPFGDELHVPFNFALIMLPWEAHVVATSSTPTSRRSRRMAGRIMSLGNHDRDRVATRVGDEQARVAAMLLLTLRGTPFIYYGDELGMRDVAIPPEQYQDPQGINLGISRDPERTPMQWDAPRYAGFSRSTETWLPVAPDYGTRQRCGRKRRSALDADAVPPPDRSAAGRPPSARRLSSAGRAGGLYRLWARRRLRDRAQSDAMNPKRLDLAGDGAVYASGSRGRGRVLWLCARTRA